MRTPGYSNQFARDVQRVPTWPWRSETARELASAIALPTVIWLTNWPCARYWRSKRR